jgi:hypothetical protein
MSGFIFARFLLWEVFPTLLVLFHFRAFAAYSAFFFALGIVAATTAAAITVFKEQFRPAPKSRQLPPIGLP